MQLIYQPEIEPRIQLNRLVFASLAYRFNQLGFQTQLGFTGFIDFTPYSPDLPHPSFAVFPRLILAWVIEIPTVEVNISIK